MGGGGTHVALFTRTVFHINLFQLGYMSVRYKRADITKQFFHLKNRPEAVCSDRNFSLHTSVGQLMWSFPEKENHQNHLTRIYTSQIGSFCMSIFFMQSCYLKQLLSLCGHKVYFTE